MLRLVAAGLSNREIAVVARPQRAHRAPARREHPAQAHAVLACGGRGARDAGRATSRARREEVDGHAVGIAQLRVALAPERVPRLLLRVEPGRRHPRVELVDLGGARALERERELIADLARPVGPEARHDLLGVEHEPRAARQRRLDVTLTVLREVDAEEPVEGDRRAPGRRRRSRSRSDRARRDPSALRWRVILDRFAALVQV